MECTASFDPFASTLFLMLLLSIYQLQLPEELRPTLPTDRHSRVPTAVRQVCDYIHLMVLSVILIKFMC
jgi:hypothetical protein